MKASSRQPIAFLLSGQGTQYFQMGAQLFKHNPTFRHWMTHCNELARPLCGKSLIDYIYCRPMSQSEAMDELSLTHPCLLALGVSLARTLEAHGICPTALLGYSLGEMIAAVLSESLSLEEAFILNIQQAHLAEQVTPPTRLIAVLAPCHLFHEKPELFQGSHLAGVNFHKNFVLAIPESQEETLISRLQSAQMSFIRLPIRRGFHSPWIDSLKDPFLQATTTLNYRPPQLPTYSCTTTKPIPHFTSDHFWQVARQTLCFEKTLQSLLAADDFLLIDISPSGTLAAIARQILGRQQTIFSVMNPFGQNLKTFEQVLNLAP